MAKTPKITSFSLIYSSLALLRILLVLAPQTGYIHPDEYFQSVEVLAGKFLNVEYSPPWEFNTTQPIRSISIPYYTVGMSYKLLDALHNVAKIYFADFNLLTPYSLLIVPRLLFCAFSFIVDYSLYKICANNNEKFKSRLLVLATSYVMLVYATHTFSNTIELILFAILLYLVSESLTLSNILTKKREYLNYRYENSKTAGDRARFHKLRLYLISDAFRSAAFVSTVTVFGFFNRPTFLAYAVIPVFFWIYRGIGSKSTTTILFFNRICYFAVCSLPGFAFCIVFDSFFYGYMTWGEIGVLDVSLNSFVFTPLNFLKYNADSGNLAKHGLHPRFLHFLVNVPLLFNVLGAFGVGTLLRYVFLCFKKRLSTLPTIRSIKCLMTLSFVVPTLILSIFPHQEPRFLIPLILPLAYLHGGSILPENEDSLIEAKRKPQNESQRSKTKKTLNLFKLWLTLNVFMTIFYGFVHQGGVFQAVGHLEKDLSVTPLVTEYLVFTSHVYSLPESFLMQKQSKRLYEDRNTKYEVNRRVFLYERGSQSMDAICEEIVAVLGAKADRKRRSKVYLLVPSSLEDELGYVVGGISRDDKRLAFYRVERFYPHLSVEAFPDLSKYCLEVVSGFYKRKCQVLSLWEYFFKIFNSFALDLYEISIKS